LDRGVLYQIQLRVSSPVIGNRWSAQRKCFEFPRDKQISDGWALAVQDRDQLNSCAANAVESLGVEVEASSLRWPKMIPLPRLYLHKVPKRSGGFTDHEAISRNTILTFYLMVRKFEGGRQLKAPNEKQIYDILKFIGDYEGISPLGSERGFGLFNLLSVALVGRSFPDDSESAELFGKDANLPEQADGGGKGSSEVGDVDGPGIQLGEPGRDEGDGDPPRLLEEGV
jgi:hypothetical protein